MSYPTKGRGRGNHTCFKCGEEGHYANACPNAAAGRGRGRGGATYSRQTPKDYEVGVCSWCKHGRHTKALCPTLKEDFKSPEESSKIQSAELSSIFQDRKTCDDFLYGNFKFGDNCRQIWLSNEMDLLHERRDGKGKAYMTTWIAAKSAFETNKQLVMSTNALNNANNEKMQEIEAELQSDATKIAVKRMEYKAIANSDDYARIMAAEIDDVKQIMMSANKAMKNSQQMFQQHIKQIAPMISYAQQMQSHKTVQSVLNSVQVDKQSWANFRPEITAVGQPTCSNCGIIGHSNNRCRYPPGASRAPCIFKGCPNKEEHCALNCPRSPVLEGYEAYAASERHQGKYTQVLDKFSMKQSYSYRAPGIPKTFDWAGQQIFPFDAGESTKFYLQTLTKVRDRLQATNKVEYKGLPDRISGKEFEILAFTANPFAGEFIDKLEGLGQRYKLLQDTCSVVSHQGRMPKPSWVKKTNSKQKTLLDHEKEYFYDLLTNIEDLSLMNPLYKFLKYQRVRFMPGKNNQTVQAEMPQPLVVDDYVSQSECTPSVLDLTQKVSPDEWLDESQYWTPFQEMEKVFSAYSKIICPVCDGNGHGPDMCGKRFLLTAEAKRYGFTAELGTMKWFQYKKDAATLASSALNNKKLASVIEHAFTTWLSQDLKQNFELYKHRKHTLPPILHPRSRFLRYHPEVQDSETPLSKFYHATESRTFVDIFHNKQSEGVANATEVQKRLQLAADSRSLVNTAQQPAEMMQPDHWHDMKDQIEEAIAFDVSNFTVAKREEGADDVAMLQVAEGEDEGNSLDEDQNSEDAVSIGPDAEEEKNMNEQL